MNIFYGKDSEGFLTAKNKILLNIENLHQSINA